MPLANPTALAALITIGTYTGNVAPNRAIAHGLPGKPILIRILCPTAASYATQLFLIMHGSDRIFTDAMFKNVTGPDSTNFYVGNSADYDVSANASGRAYKWVAFL